MMSYMLLKDCSVIKLLDGSRLGGIRFGSHIHKLNSYK